MLIEGPGYYGPPQSRSATKTTKGALSLANTTAATYQTCLMLPTTLTAVIGSALRLAIAACSIYRCARILNTFISFTICLQDSKRATKITKRAITRDYADRNICSRLLFDYCGSRLRPRCHWFIQHDIALFHTWYGNL